MHHSFVKALFDPGLPVPAEVADRPGRQARFAVYRNNVRASLTEALAATFPVCRQLVGEDFFRALAGVYIGEQPPTSPLLTDYGRTLPAFIERFPPAAPVPYLADMARLELAWLEAQHAADPSPLDRAALAALLTDEQRLPGQCLRLQPSVRLLRSGYGVVSLWRAHQGQLPIASVDPCRPENALLLRPGLSVRVISPSDVDTAFVDALLRRLPLGAALEQTLHRYPDFEPGPILALLLEHQAIAAFYPAGASS